MQRAIEWAVRNSPAMNTLMVSILIVGGISLILLRREEFPEFELEVVLVTVPYPGASPEEVEQGICLKLEEAVRSVDGIKKQTSIAKEGSGFLVLELDKSVDDVEKVLNEVRSEIDRIPSFPEFAEEPDVKQITIRQSAIQIAVLGPDVDTSEAQWQLRQLSERVRDDLLQLPSISQANLIGVRDFQIDIEIPETNLRAYGLTLQRVAELVRRENIEVPGGLIQTDSQDLLLRGKNKQLLGEEIAQIPLVTQPNGVVLTVGDLGGVRDGFVDEAFISRIEGRPGLMISVDRTADEDIIAIVDEVREYVVNASLPDGFELQIWDDRSDQMRKRLQMLGRNALAGLVLVFLMLAIFLELRLAFWVALGIPVSVLGAAAFLLYFDHSLNLLSTFAFLMALGIVVDDAIVIGENIYEHRQRGKKFVRAAIEGAVEVLPSVVASVTTTIIAFLPLMFVTGDMGKFVAVIPVAVIVMLVVSLIESMIILPCHLAHSYDPSAESLPPMERLKRAVARSPMLLKWSIGYPLVVSVVLLRFLAYPIISLGASFGWLNVRMDRLMRRFVRRIYVPSLGWSLHNPAIVLSLAVALLLVSIGFVQSGITPFVLVQKIDTNMVEAHMSYPDGTAEAVTDRATRNLEAALREIDREYREQGIPIVKHVQRTVGFVFGEGGPGDPRGGGSFSGSHVGGVRVELAETDRRTISAHRIVAEWRQAVGQIPGVESLQFIARDVGPAEKPIEFKLVAEGRYFDQLEQAAEQCKTRLREYPGVFDVADDSTAGKWEFQLRIRDSGKTLGVSVADLAETVRASYYGEEAMRLQRGRHEVKLMVRYPREDRRSFSKFAEILVPTATGEKKSLVAVVDVDVARGQSEINRIDQVRSITITADVDETTGNAYDTTSDLRDNFMPQVFEEFPAVAVRWEGQQEQTTESIQSLFRGFQVAMFGMFVLLTLAFRSYIQPLLILAIVPFGAIGAVAGHTLLGYPITIFSVFGMVALTGVVVNDSIVLIDFINKRVHAGLPIRQALLDAGRRRFRPVVLTSITTIAGLLPLLTETSFQAQLIIPMAISLCFGLMAATLLVLFLVPVFYLAYSRLTHQFDEQPQDSNADATADLPVRPV